MPTTTAARCTIRDAEPDEIGFFDLVAAQAGLPVPRQERPRTTRVALQQGQVVGFATVTVCDGQPILDHVFVHHHARRAGVGRALVLDTRRCGEPVRIESHPAAEMFFRCIGARREGTIRPGGDTPFCRPVFSLP